MRQRISEKARKTVRDYAYGRLESGISAASVAIEIETGDFRWRPSRSTIYAWAQAIRDAQARDKSGRWLLAHDETGRPDLVLKVFAAVTRTWNDEIEKAGETTVERVVATRRIPPPPEITVAEAAWIAKLGALILPNRPGNDMSRTAMRDLRRLARDYVTAELDNDEGRLAILDGQVAGICFWDWED